MSREKERFAIGAEPVLICATSHDRVPYITNVGDVPIQLDFKKWPENKGLILAPGATVPFVNPMPATDATPIFAACPGGKGEVEYLFLR
jgi:hypothetical protein